MSLFRRDYNDTEMAVLMLREHLADAAPDVLDNSPASGCCGCGAWLADVVTPPSDGYPSGEAYCWKCVRKHRINEYTVLPGRER